MSTPDPVILTPSAHLDTVPSSGNASETNLDRQGGNRQRSNNINPTNAANLEGDCPSLSAVLGLRVERLNKKLPFHQFTEKVYFHAFSTYKDGGDLHPLFFDFDDPLNSLVTKHRPINPEPISNEDESIDEVDPEIYKEEIKQFIQRKLNLQRNTEKAYGLIWGQCSAALQAFIKGLSEYEEHAACFDTIWLLKKLKKATLGIDSKANA